jgi:universal stress protein A
MFTRILVPTDFSGPSDAALEYAKALADRFGASLHLVHVLEDQVVGGAFGADPYLAGAPAYAEALRADAEARLAARLTARERIRLHGSSEIASGPSARTIVEIAESHGIDLIVMGTHGRTGLAHALIGSVAERVVRSAPCPVLTLHAMPERIPMRESAWAAALPACG